MLSDVIVEYANVLINDGSWDIDTLHSPNQHRFGTIEYEDDKIKLRKTKKLDVPMNPESAYMDGYIDDLISICLDTPNVRERCENTVPLLIHSTFHPLAADEPIKRSDLLSLRKLYGEVNLGEKIPSVDWT